MSFPITTQRILVTGGCGFIGAHLVRALSDAGCHAIVFDRTPLPPWLRGLPGVEFRQGELLDLLATPEALANVDTVFHLAWAHIPESATQHPVGDIQSNLVGTVRLLQACVERGVRRVIFPSTGGAIYGPVDALPVSESHLTRPISAYGVTKLAVEKYIQLYHHLHGLEYAILRPSVPYGPYQDPFGRQGAVCVFIGDILTGKPITLWGDGDAIVRDFFHVSDLARALILAAESAQPAGLYNIGGGEGVSLLQLVERLRHLAEPDFPVMIEQSEPRRFDVPRLVLNINHAAEALDWRPQISLDEGLTQTWHWFRHTWLTTIPSS
ncbi:MAG: NAD-dependent epimerase/dehydratase family protein [Caldilineales bacterium]|nr:NAD-dependent epimerase/dehydratase family protein [Caldilineales bacterium]